MPGKSGRGRRWRQPQSKRRKDRRSPATEVVHQQATTPSRKEELPSEVPAPSAGVSAQEVAVASGRYPYIASELRRIGILAGVILVTLVILAVALP
jgi:hypothetical protein